MTMGEVVTLVRRIYGDETLLLDPFALEMLRNLLEAHESDVRERCAVVAEQGMEDSLEAQLIAAAIRGEAT